MPTLLKRSTAAVDLRSVNPSTGLRAAIVIVGLAVCGGPTAASAEATSFAVQPSAAVKVTMMCSARTSGTVLRLPRNRVAVTRSGSAVRLTRDGRRAASARVTGKHFSVSAELRDRGRTLIARIGVTRARIRGLRREYVVATSRSADTGCRTRVAGATPVGGTSALGTTPSGGTAPAAARAPAAPGPTPRATAPAPAVARLFAPTSFWNAPLARQAPLDSQSAAYSAELQRLVQADLAARRGPWIMTTSYSTPLYRVPDDQPTVRVQLDGGAWNTGLQHAFEAVPIPPTARPAEGNDGHLTIWQPGTGKLWEFWVASHQVDGWHAEYGGAIANVGASPGFYDASSWPGSDWYWGATATSLPVIGGTMLIDELRAGRIDHALAMAIPSARHGTFSWPAQRSDGTNDDSAAIPEGARFRLDPSLDIDRLDLPPFTRMMAEAAQRYGMVVRDQTAHAVGFYGEDPTPTGSDPYPALFGGLSPLDLLARFPWDHVQLLDMELSSR